MFLFSDPDFVTEEIDTLNKKRKQDMLLKSSLERRVRKGRSIKYDRDENKPSLFAYTYVWDEIMNPFLNGKNLKEIISSVRNSRSRLEQILWILSRYGDPLIGYVLSAGDRLFVDKQISFSYKRLKNDERIKKGYDFELEDSNDVEEEKINKLLTSSDEDRWNTYVNGKPITIRTESFFSIDLEMNKNHIKITIAKNDRSDPWKTGKYINKSIGSITDTFSRELWDADEIIISFKPKFDPKTFGEVNMDMNMNNVYDTTTRSVSRLQDLIEDDSSKEYFLKGLKNVMTSVLDFPSVSQPSSGLESLRVWILPPSKIVYKGIKNKWWHTLEYDSSDEDSVKNIRFDHLERSFTSASQDVKVSKNGFVEGNCCTMEIHYQPHTCATIDVSDLLKDDQKFEEREILFPPWTKYRVIGKPFKPSRTDMWFIKVQATNDLREETVRLHLQMMLLRHKEGTPLRVIN